MFLSKSRERVIDIRYLASSSVILTRTLFRGFCYCRKEVQMLRANVHSQTCPKQIQPSQNIFGIREIKRVENCGEQQIQIIVVLRQ